MKQKTIDVFTEQHSAITVKKQPNTTVVSTVLVAAALFIVVNLGSVWIDKVYKHSRGGYRSVDFIISAFDKVAPRPNIVLLGSSLMRMPFYLSDATHSNYVPSYEEYINSQTLERILNANGLKNSKVFNLAIDGTMASDAFLINRKLFNGANSPEWVIYGIAPRDFIDKYVPEETRTLIFDRLFTTKDILAQNNGFVLNPIRKLDMLIEKICFFFDRRQELQTEFTDMVSNLATPQSNRKSRQIDPFAAPPNTNKAWWDPKSAWKRSIAEYSSRYQILNREQFLKQEDYLKEFCIESHKKNIKVLLVNMPLTKENVELMPAGLSSIYHDAICKVSKLPGIHLLDLQYSNKFPKDLFRDSAHLNEKGSHVLSMMLSKALVAYDPAVALTTRISSGNSNKTACSSRSLNALSPRDGLASWWMAKAYFADPKPPDVVVLGGSQLGSLQGADAYVYNRAIDITGDHRCYVLEHDLQGFLSKTWKVFISAMPETLMSDQLLIARSLFSSAYKPKLVAIAFSPRDFIDNNCISPIATEPFAFFSKYANCSDSTSLRCALKNNCGVYAPQKSTYDECKGTSPLILGKPFERICRGEIMITSGDGYVFTDNAAEYRRRYKNPISPRLELQLHSLDTLLSYLAQRHIKVVAFGLPLTNANKKLLPETFWSFYNEHIREICKKHGADWIDIEHEVKGFDDKEFIDDIHLNLIGGHRLASTIALYVANKFHWKTFAELESNEKNLL